MTTFQFDNKSVQTDPDFIYSRPKLQRLLKTYLTVVNQYRLHLFNRYTQSDESYNNQDLFHVRRKILGRFDWVIIELEILIENLQRRRISIIDVQQSIDRPLIKEVIETSLNAELSYVDNHNGSLTTDIDEWQIYRRHLEEAKKDLHVSHLFTHRFDSKADQMVHASSCRI